MSKDLPLAVIEQRIFFIRGQKVMVDRDLAQLYGVETKYLNRQVRRNRDRFPEEFMFRLTAQEREQLVTNCHRFKTMKHSSALPCVFTEHGVAMLASVLNSQQAVELSVYIIKVFIHLRNLLGSQKEFAQKIIDLEHKYEDHDGKIHAIFEAIRRMMEPQPEKPKRKIGFIVDREEDSPG